MSENNTQKNTTHQGDKPQSSQGGKKRYYRKKKTNNNTTSPQIKKTPLEPNIKVRNYKPKNTKPPTFGEVQYSDKVTFVLAGVTLISSLVMWFMGKPEEAIFVGMWVPGIFSASCFIRLSFTRAKRK